MNEKRIYMFVEWQLPLGKHTCDSKVFDGSGELVHKHRYRFRANQTDWNTWIYRKINKRKDKPGKWRFEAYMDGLRMVEEYLTVLPE